MKFTHMMNAEILVPRTASAAFGADRPLTGGRFAPAAR